MKLRFAHTSVALVAAVLFNTLCWGQTAATNTSSPCANTPLGTTTSKTQLQAQCAAAASAQGGSTSSTVLWKVWAGVGTVCTSACLSPTPAGAAPGANSMQNPCKQSDGGAGVTDAAITKDYTSAMSTVGTQTLAGGQNSNGGGGLGANPSCMMAAQAFQKSWGDYNTSQAANQTAATALNNAANLDDPNAPVAAGTSQAATAGSDPVSQAASAADCSDAQNTGNVSAAIRCAAQNDPSLPAFVASSSFPEAFQKISGTPLGDLLTNTGAANPTDTVAAAAGSSAGSPEGAAQLASALKGVEDKYHLADGVPASEGGVYASAGGADPAPGAPDTSMNDALTGLLAKMKSGDKKDATSGISQVAFANQQSRSPASLAENSKLSIFDRVSFRYILVGNRVTSNTGAPGEFTHD